MEVPCKGESHPMHVKEHTSLFPSEVEHLRGTPILDCSAHSESSSIFLFRLLEGLEEDKIVDRQESAEGRTSNLPYSKSVHRFHKQSGPSTACFTGQVFRPVPLATLHCLGEIFTLCVCIQFNY
ncbi:hypothetical protein GQR58_013489 [Nymphon striatum]|nr:hypothetical protein GQR58_013489 [Nymphon striatum]